MRSLRQAVLFLIDTQGANCVGCYRSDGLPLGTTNLDRLAQNALKFTRAYTCAPVCAPARSTIFTGLFPHSSGVLANDLALHSDVPSIGQRLSAAGISTGYVGKWHLDGLDYFGDGRCPPGWDPAIWFDGRNYLHSLPTPDARALSRQVLTAKDVSTHGITSEFTHAHRSVDRALAFIHDHRDRDFFLVVSIDEPHHPFICPQPFVSQFENFRFPVTNAHDPLINKPSGQRDWAEFAASPHRNHLVETPDGKSTWDEPAYFACNSYCDSQVGRVLAAMEAEVPNALTIYTSDHGDMFGSHGLVGKGPCLYEEITHVPLLINWPGKTEANTSSDGLASHVDLVPTLLEFFDLPRPALLQGRSLLRQCQDPHHVTNERIFIEFNRYEVDHDSFGAFAPIRGVFDGRHKLSINLLDDDEFYDLAEDPGELNNLISRPATTAMRDQLHTELMGWMNRTRDPLRGPHWYRRNWQRGPRRSTWQGPTRPRPADENWFPPSLLYETALPAVQHEYAKH